MTGRRPKPSLIKELEGNRSKVARSKLTRDVQGKGTPRLPSHLSPEEKQIWLDVIQAMPSGLLTMADESVLERFAVAFARWRNCQRALVAQGLILVKIGKPDRTNPLIQIQDRAERAMHVAGEALGLSPVARARLARVDSSGDEDPMALLLGLDNDPAGAWRTMPPGTRHQA